MSELSEAIDTVQLWLSMWIDDQAELDSVSPCDTEERKVIAACQRILKAVPPEKFVTDREFMGKWCPERCPVTLRPFFMWLEHPERGWLPTYGGPYDSYTIPEPDLPENAKLDRIDVEYRSLRFDHDEGWWVEGTEDCEMRITTEEALLELGAWPE